MGTCGFDPFENRLARDIRNQLSSALIASLDAGDPEPFRSVARDYLNRGVDPSYREYIEDRFNRYEQVFAEIFEQQIEDPFVQTVLLWNKGLLFEVHERLESFWRDLPPETRKAVKGIIQATAAYIHKQYGHDRAARALAGKAARLLKSHGKFLPAAIKVDEAAERLERLDFELPMLM